MRFSADWLDEAPNAAPEERATACELRMAVGGRNACLHLDGSDNKIYDHVTMPAYSLADGLAHDWWSLVGARDQDYLLFKHRMGYAVPDVRFRFDGAVFEARADQRSYHNPDIRFWSVPIELMTWEQAEESLARFVDEILLRLEDSGVKQTSATLRWRRVCSSRQDPEEAAFCEAAGALGVDPYGIADQESTFIERCGRLFSGEPLIEFLAGMAHQSDREMSLAWIKEIEGRPAPRSQLPGLGAVATQVALAAPLRGAERSWAVGYRRARATRAALGLRASDPPRTVSQIAELLGNRTFGAVPHVNGLRALVATHDESTRVYLPERGPVPELFAFGRALGDAICFPDTRRAVVNDLRRADRQAAGRAFAAEFLAPIDEISSMREDGKDVAGIADALIVSAEVVERQIENRDRIREACR